jgi:predicted class III extradiol MEMO1 family dioxygenase
MNELNLRQPAVAGSFYAGDSKSLNIEIENCFLHKIGPGEIPLVNPKRKSNIIGLVSPHAGYMYSGPVAANGFYKIASDGKPDTIIILGPNHRGFGEDVSIIIQYIFGKNTKFIPICMTRQDINTDIEIAQSICSSVVDKDILIIASSDFTHYEPQEYAENVDKQAVNAILEFNPKKLYDMIYQQNLSMCGPGPITVMLVVCETLGAKKAELLKYATSGDVSGMYDQVVGYASIAIRK